ncbi:F-box/LRR-repeat protein At5g02910 [Lactuca sativa]|uniref:F-box domain-containing protein n=1 Tax=Lactuca sativa TaxID=4236 RepID=A0A9R1W4H6_LACSA|nr:F-box/LRR-repeat protein At5g02910 [Lactuca sativa]KAJ0219697.1 hypothetical protein LSAT_V11C200075650 [Lactuca sativa]
MEVDILSYIPEALQLRILCCLDAKQAVQTSMLSRTWVSLWTKTPVLNFKCSSFNNLDAFNTFVNKVLCRRDHLAKLDTVKFLGLIRSTQTLKSVFDFAFSHGVKQLEVSIHNFAGSNAWPSLKVLQSWCHWIMCPFLGSGSTSFKNLTVLHLTHAIIRDVEPYSGFPILESLKLLYCNLSTNGNINKTLRVYSLRLSHLTISWCTSINCCKLETPRLRFLIGVPRV